MASPGPVSRNSMIGVEVMMFPPNHSSSLVAVSAMHRGDAERQRKQRTIYQALAVLACKDWSGQVYECVYTALAVLTVSGHTACDASDDTIAMSLLPSSVSIIHPGHIAAPT